MTALYWFLLAVAFFAIDLMLPTLVLLFFGLGALAASLSNVMGLDLRVQILVFIAVSLISLLILRSRLTRIFAGKTRSLPARDSENSAPEHPLLGRTGRVSRQVSSDCPGEVEIDGSFWRARARENLSVGTQVRVVGVDESSSLLLLIEALR